MLDTIREASGAITGPLTALDRALKRAGAIDDVAAAEGLVGLLRLKKAANKLAASLHKAVTAAENGQRDKGGD